MSFPSQVDFFKKIKDTLPAKISLVDELADLLGITNDGIYRRLRGETQLSFTEIQKICTHFKMSFTPDIKEANRNVNFEYSRLGSDDSSFSDYLTGLCDKLSTIGSLQNSKAVFAAESLPLFYHFLYPELTRFKIYFWSKAVMNISTLRNTSYNDFKVDPAVTAIAMRSLELYCSIPCTEVWNDNTIDGTLKQIEYYWETGVFPSKEVAMQVCSETLDMLNHIEEQAAKNAKFIPGKRTYPDTFQLYTSDVGLGCNSIFVTADHFRLCFFAPHTFNSIITSNEEFCGDTENWLNGLIGKSTLVSGSAEKQRFQFFERKRERIQKLMEKIR